MQFYSGPLMHFLSGVDTQTQFCFGSGAFEQCQ
jgi:hypothetical protein